jgi:hypothetical protein
MILIGTHDKWVNKKRVFHCHKCNVHLGMMHWKHHCRSCGQIFCADCSSYLTKVPYGELCTSRPDRIKVRNPQRCCFECHRRIGEHIQTEDPYITPQCRALRGILGVQLLETHDLLVESHYDHTNLYAIQLPEDGSIQALQTITVKLGGVYYRTTVPAGTPRGGEFHVLINDGFLDAVEYVGGNDAIVEVVTLGSSNVVDDVARKVRKLAL